MELTTKPNMSSLVDINDDSPQAERACRTISTEAALVLSTMPPLDSLAGKRTEKALDDELDLTQ